MNVADWRGVELVRSLAESGVAVAVHFPAHRKAIASLVEHIWDSGGRICAFDATGGERADHQTFLQEARLALGDVQMVVDASRRSNVQGPRPAGTEPGRRKRVQGTKAGAAPPVIALRRWGRS